MKYWKAPAYQAHQSFGLWGLQLETIQDSLMRLDWLKAKLVHRFVNVTSLTKEGLAYVPWGYLSPTLLVTAFQDWFFIREPWHLLGVSVASLWWLLCIPPLCRLACKEPEYWDSCCLKELFLLGTQGWWSILVLLLACFGLLYELEHNILTIAGEKSFSSAQFLQNSILL